MFKPPGKMITGSTLFYTEVYDEKEEEKSA
jgi:hypothetical protein